MTIRLLTPDDYDALLALWRACPGLGLNALDDSRDGYLRYLRRNPTTCFAAEEDGALIGAILAGHDGRRGYIYHAAVHPDHRRQGVGSALVEAALCALQREGIHKAALVAFATNESGNAFWEKQGFDLREDLSYRNRALSQMQRLDT